MHRIQIWYARFPAAARLAGSLVLALILTFALLYAYMTAFHSPHPYLVGLFPVIVCSLALGFWPGVLSLAVSSVYFGLLLLPSSPGQQLVLTVLFVIEGIVVLWLVRMREKTTVRLADSLSQRERELSKLSKAHDQLVADGALKRQTTEQVRESNRIMLGTLERILDEYEDRA